MASGNGVEDDYHLATAENVPTECDLCVLSDQRLFYLHHPTKKSYWEPPRVSWNCQLGLPYGWEEAIDAFGIQYFINHLTKTTTYEDPRQSTSASPNSKSSSDEPSARSYEIHRHPEIGFGFVAASQRPVIVQFVTPGGPSDGKLLANDQILEVNGMDVRELDKDEVVGKIRTSESPLSISVAQLPPKQKPKIRRNCRVRFTDRVQIADNAQPNQLLPLMPNVVRVFLENGQTKSFKYDQNTTVKDVLVNLVAKLRMKCVDRFALSLEQSISTRAPKLSLLRNDLLINHLASLPCADHVRCRFRLTFIPHDLREFAIEDPVAFNYWYEQCVNDVVAGRYAYEMRYEPCIRLAALHIRQVALDTNTLKSDGSVSITRMEKEYGLATFLPTILLENVKKKEIRKHLRYYLKKDECEQPHKVVSPKISFSPRHCATKKNSLEDSIPSCFLITDPNDLKLTVRLKYIQLLMRLPTFGGRNFFVTFKQTYVDMVMQVDPYHGLHVKHPGKLAQPAISIDYELIDSLHVSQETDVLKSITIKLKNSNQPGLEFVLDKDDIYDLVIYISGYIKILLDKEITVEYNSNIPESSVGAFAHKAPPYKGTHFVYPAGWNYSNEVNPGSEMIVSFATGPPEYEEAMKATNTNFGEESLPPTPKSTKCNGATGSRRSSPFFGDISSISSEKTTPSKRGSESSAKSKLLHVKDSLLVKESNKKRFRDSIRIHKKRHSLPNGTPVSSPTPSHRRSSSRRASESSVDSEPEPDFSHMPNIRECRKELTNIALSNQVLESSSPRGGSPAMLPRPVLCIKRSSLTPSEHSVRSDKDRLSPLLGHYTDTPRKSSFGLNSPDQIPVLLNLQENHLTTSDSGPLDNNNIEKLLALFPDRVCTDSDIIDLTSPDTDTGIRVTLCGPEEDLDSEERKHVRFDFTSTSLSPPPTSKSKDSISGGAKDRSSSGRKSSPEKSSCSASSSSAKGHRFGFSPPHLIFAINHVSRRRQKGANKKPTGGGCTIAKEENVFFPPEAEDITYKAGLSTSRTFPMSEQEMMEEFGEDFVPRSYKTMDKADDGESGPSGGIRKIEVRRMSLKEYSGLESPTGKNNHSTSVSPLLPRMQRTSLASAPHSPCINLLDKFSDRRRSSAGLSRGPYCDAYADPFEPSDSRLSYTLTEDGENQAQKLQFLHDKTVDFKAIHERLTESLEKVPNESPRRKQTVDSEKVTMLNECRRLATACKNMVRSASLNPTSSNTEWRYAVLEAVEVADRVTSIAETVLRKSNSVFQAQLMTAKTNQMLRALAETLQDLEKAYGAPKFGIEAKQLIRSSTTLAATLTQLIQTVRSL